MANSIQLAVSDGTLVLLNLSIDYFDRSEITVFFDSVEVPEGSGWAWVGLTDKSIAFAPAVPNGVEVLVKRTTDLSKLRHEFSTGAAFAARILDEDLKQVLHIAQEAAESNLSGEFFVDINMHGKRITNVADAVGPSDVLTKGQFDTAIGDALTDADAATTAANAAAASATSAASSANTAAANANALGTSLSAGSGTTLVGHTQAGTGATARPLQDVLRESIITLKGFGAVGDGVADDTLAVSRAVTYMVSTGNNVTVTPGTYLSDPFSVNSQAYAWQANFVGTDRERCIIKRRTAGAGAFITLGAANGTAFQAGVGLKNLTVDGGPLSNGDTFLGYDIVRTTFENVRFTGGTVGTHLLGGISINFLNCLWEASHDGLRIDKFTSLAGGGWPNLIRVSGGEIVDCHGFGVYFDNGRMLILDNVEIENNGLNLGAVLEGGVYVGPNVGAEISVTDTYSIGLIADKCWFEANRGRADIVLESGINFVGKSNFFSTPAQSTNDFLINGGRYTIEGCNCSFSKTNNLFENAGVLSGNSIRGSDIPNLSIDQAKTTVFSINKILTRGGVVPVFTDLAIPYEQFGSNSTPGGGTVDITFAVPFVTGTVPKVFIEVNNGDSATSISQPCVSNLTRFGFRVRILSIGTGSSTISSISAGFNWRAVGTL